MLVNQPRFVVLSREPFIDTTVSEHDTATEAQTYIEALGRPGKHVDLYIVDRSKNVIADASNEEETAKLTKALDLESKRKALMDIQEENIKRAEDLKARQSAIATSNG